MLIQHLHPTDIVNNGMLRVVSEPNGKLTVKVLDTEGKIAKSLTTILEEGIQDLFLNLSDLRSGVYVLNAFGSGNFLKSIKFVKK